MKRPYQICSLVIILFCTFVIRESLELTYMTPIGPGPGFFSLWVALLVGVLAAIMFLQATFQKSDPMPDNFFPSRDGFFRLAAVTLAMIGSVMLMNSLGFRFTMLGFLLFLLFALGRQNWIVAVLVSLAGSFGTYHVFVNMLKVPLPTGMLGL